MIIWDDRIWLGNAYVQLYKVFKVEKYLRIAVRLYNFVVENNWKMHNYDGIEWKPKTNYKNTITNSLFLVLCGRLYDVTFEEKYIDSMKKMYRYLFTQENKFANGVK